MIPKFYECFPRVMQFLSDDELHSIAEIREFCAEKFGVSDEEREMLQPSGKVRVFNDRVSWACSYLKLTALIESPSRGKYRLTEQGHAEIANGAVHITPAYLKEKYDSYPGHRRSASSVGGGPLGEEPTSSEPTPKEALEDAYNALNATLADELMAEIMQLKPHDFERLIVKLLIKMGYGSPQFNENAVTKPSGDEGIDGIVAADKLGFDVIYFQAKQWGKNSCIGRPEIQKFMGALAGQQGALKGLFITTCRFSKEAITYADKSLQSKIVLVDGDMLAKLMIEHNVGVSTVETYDIKRVDTDFFNDEL